MKPKPQKQTRHILNERILADNVRLVGDNVENGVYPRFKAQNIAKSMGLDLIQLSEQNNIAICRIEDYGKFLYNLEKKEKDSKKQNKDMKEIRFGANTSDHDIEIKSKKIKEFVLDGHKVKISLKFNGREIAYKDRGEILLLKVIEALSDSAKPEYMPKLEGKNFHCILTPKK